MEKTPLLPLPQGCVVGRFIRRYKRFSVEMLLDGQNVWVHSNNSGSMLGLTLAGAPLLASPAANPARKLPYTQEAVWLAERAVPSLPGGEEGADGSALGPQLHGAGVDAEGQRGLHGAHTFGNLHRVLLTRNAAGRPNAARAAWMPASPGRICRRCGWNART